MNQPLEQPRTAKTELDAHPCSPRLTNNESWHAKLSRCWPEPGYSLPGARPALVLLLLINLFNYIDRQVLAAVVGPIKQTFFGASGVPANSDTWAPW